MKLISIILSLALSGCVTLKVDTKYGAFGVGTDGKSLNVGFTPGL